MNEKYDVAVIGSGPGGYVAGIKAAQAGLKSVVIEKDRLGGVCLNWGCIPTKALLRGAELYEAVTGPGGYGFITQAAGAEPGFDAGALVGRSRQVADRMNRGVASLLKKYNVAHVQGTARFSGPGELEISAPDGSTGRLEAKSYIIATGARPRAIGAFPVDGTTVITYREALVLEKFPQKLLVVGGGAIGVEFSYYFATFGVEVHLVEMLPQLLPHEDEEIAGQLLRSFRKKGIHCYPGTAVEDFMVQGQGQEALVRARLNDGRESAEHSFDMALIAVGMEPAVQGLGLEAAGVALSENGFITVDDHMRTSQPHIYAIGDVTGRQLLAHKASAEAEAAVAALAGESHHGVDYANMPACTYCQPQVASVGLTEKQCQEQGLQVRIGRFPFAASGKANAMGHTEGMVKLIFGEPHGQLLGAHMIGPEVTELLAELALAIRLEATAEEILATIHAHPTLSEAVFEAAGAAFGKSPNI